MTLRYNTIFLAILATWSTLIVTTAAVACYAPDGRDRNAQFNTETGNHYAPCDPTAAVSMCCAIGPVRIAGRWPDTCDNGLCRNRVLLWRESCTDPTWTSRSCLKLFVNGTGMAGSGPPMIREHSILASPDFIFEHSQFLRLYFVILQSMT